jgi:hypothetical protein
MWGKRIQVVEISYNCDDDCKNAKNHIEYGKSK